MGLSPAKNCCSGVVVDAPAPNPRPDRWTLVKVHEWPKAFVLLVRYHDATNFEGLKVMVFRGVFPGKEAIRARNLDPHFTPDDSSPVARFRPDREGIDLACRLAKELGSP